MRLARMTGVALATMAMVAAPASAKTITLHYYFQQVGVTLTNPAGHRVSPHTRTVAGDVGDEVGVAYLGNHNHHAKRWTASFHLRCVFRRSKRAICDGQIAIGGSMLLANGPHLNLAGNLDRLPINGGTGVFQHARGTLISISHGNTNNSDITIRLRNIARARVA